MARKPAVLVSLIADWDGKDLDRAQKEIAALQKEANAAAMKMQDVGKKLSMAVTAPLVGIGVAAGKLAMDFDDSMTKIVSLVGIGADEVNQMKESVLGLAGQTAKAPEELADALFVVTSAGLRGEDAMNALEMSAKAGAAGLGETADIARALAGAMNAYGPTVVDAARATDMIVATARAGNFETSQFAASIGEILPFAKMAGASLEDMGGAIALITRTNGDAAKATTQVKSLFEKMVVPTEEMKKVLTEVGLSASDLRKAIEEEGLPAALTMLDEKLGGNREQLGKLLGSSEAAAAAFQILDADAQTIADTFGAVSAATGITDEAFDVASQTAGFKFRQAITSLQTALIGFGDQITPIISGVSNGITGLANAFGALPAPMKTVMLALGAVAAAVGPVLFIGGKLLMMFNAFAARALVMKATMLTAFTQIKVGASTMVANMKIAMIAANTQMGALAAGGRVMAAGLLGAFRVVGAGVKGLIASFGPIGIALVGVTLAIEMFMGRSSDMRAELTDLKDTVDKTTGAITDLSVAMVGQDFRMNLDEKDVTILNNLGLSVQDLIDAATGGPEALDEFNDEIVRLRYEVGSGGQTSKALDKAADMVNEYAGALDEAGDAARHARDAAVAAARGVGGSGSSAGEARVGFDSATESLSYLEDGYDTAGDAALEFAGDVAQSAAIGAQAATAIGVAMGQVPAQAMNAINQPWYFEMLRRMKDVGDGAKQTFGSGGTTSQAFDEFETRVTDAMETAGQKIDDVVASYRDAWQDAYKEALSFGQGLSSGLAGQINFSSAVDAAKEGGGSITGAIADQAGGIIAFGDKLQQLLQTDLSEEAFAMVAGMSADRGIQLADELLGANSAQIIQDFNKVLEAVTFVSDTVGAMAAEKWYGEGVRFAQKTYEGVRDNFKPGGPAYKAVMGVMNKLARDSARQAELEVRITRKVNEEVTRTVTTIGGPPGVNVEGFGARGAIVRRPTVALIGEAGPEALLPLDRTRGNSPVSDLRGGGVTINVTAGLGTDGAEVGRQIVDALKAYERRNGAVYASA